MRKLAAPAVLPAVVLAMLAIAPSAQGAVTDAFDGQLTGAQCEVLTGADAGRVACRGIVKTFDGTNIDVNLFLPSDTPPAGGLPAMGMYHGWGGEKIGLNSRSRGFLARGYAVFSMTDRGWHDSCGGTDPKKLTDPAGCAKGYIHLMDTRYEVRDAQHLIGLLVDDGYVDPQRIGAQGGSYGGGVSMALGALKDRIMLPNGTYAPWTTPDGAHPKIAGAAPEIPWTDLGYSLAPNGATLDYVADAPYKGPNGDRRIGVLKQSFTLGLFAVGLSTGTLATPLTDPDADIITWYTLLNAGEPYDQNPLAADILEEVTTHHSSYYIDHSQAPAPMLISNGWTDDLFPADEAIRFYNRTKTQYPNSHMGLFFLDYGHMRGRSNGNDVAQLTAAENEWLDHFVKGDGPAPTEQVSTLPQTCDGSSPSGSRINAPDWASIAPGEVRLDDAAQKTIAPVGLPTTAFDPVAGGGACATASGADAPTSANYRFPAAPSGGYEFVGSATVVADIFNPSPTGQVAARLLDVGPGGQETLVSRGLWRPHFDNPLQGGTRQVFQLHPNRWHFAEGHVAKIELMGSDVPYGRLSNGQLPITVSNLQARLPVADAPGSAGGLVSEPAPKVLPDGYALAADFIGGSGSCDVTDPDCAPVTPVANTGGGGGGGAATSAPGTTTASKAKRCKRARKKSVKKSVRKRCRKPKKRKG